MSKNKKKTPDEKALIKRYLIWCYKTTKEELDKIDRKFTQLMADDIILKELLKVKIPGDTKIKDQYLMKVDDFRKYRDAKEKNAYAQKYFDIKFKTPRPHYLYLKNRVLAVEKAIRYFFNEAELKDIKAKYETEMTGRILAARENH